MKVKRVDGLILEQMLKSGLANLKNHEQEVNQINVFPVPDGDTGSNMRLTLENGIEYAKSNEDAGAYLKSLAKGMLYGSRGNSGVILSQIFAGFAEELERDSLIDAKEFVEGFTTGYKKAYNAVTNPKEGTLLTVSREGVSRISDISRGTYIDVFFSIYLAELQKSLANTPNILITLREANVVDSGGLGYVFIVEGMLKFLNDEYIDINTSTKQIEENVQINNISGYEVDLVFKLFEGNTSYDEHEFISSISNLGKQVITSRIDSSVKVHIIIDNPSDIINFVLKLGSIVTCDIKAFNINEQKMNLITHEHVSLGKIIISNGMGLKKIYEDLGASLVINGGVTMNTSCEEIIEAIKMVDASNYVIITNNKNINPAAYQAIDVLKANNIEVIESKDFLEGYFALANDDPSSNNIKFRINSMRESIDYIKTISIFKANKDARINGVRISEGNYASISDGIILDSDSELLGIIYWSLKKLENIDSYQNLIILKGINYTLSDNDVISKINSKFPNLEVTFMYGGQKVQNAIIGLL